MTGSFDADEAHRVQLMSWLRHGAELLGVTVDGEVRFGWFDRTAGVHVKSGDGSWWLRVVQEAHQWADGDFWTGNRDADAIGGARKPRVLTGVEWSDMERRYRAELTTFVPDQPISATMTVRTLPALDGSWWSDLHASLGAVSMHTTTRVRVDPDWLHLRLLAAFGVNIKADTVVWTTAHGDLHWGNLTAPTCWLLDWESWGTAPKGYDAATLYCVSLPDAATARKVWQEFAGLLDTPDGAVAQLAATARLLKFVDDGSHTDLAPALHREAQRAMRTHLAGVMP